MNVLRNIGHDTLVVYWLQDDLVAPDTYLIKCYDTYKVRARFHYIDLTLSANVLGTRMHSVYTDVAALCWNASPTVIVLFVSCKSCGYSKRSRFHTAVRTMAVTSWLRLWHVSTDDALAEVFTKYPIPICNLVSSSEFVQSGIHAFSNVLRFAAASATADIAVTSKVALVGMNGFQTVACIRCGLTPLIYEKVPSPVVSPYNVNVESSSNLIHDIKDESDIGYDICDLVFRRYGANVCVIGDHIVSSLQRARYMYKWNKAHKVIYSRAIDASSNRIHSHFKKYGWKITREPFRYTNYTESRFKSLSYNSESSIVIDLTYNILSAFNSVNVCFKFYAYMIAFAIKKRVSFEVYFKFIYSSEYPNNIIIEFLKDVILLPNSTGKNATVLLLLSTCGSTTMLSYDKHVNSLYMWANMSLRDRYSAYMSYFNDIVIYDDFYNVYESVRCPIIALFALSSVINGDAIATKRKLSAMLRWSNEHTISVIFTLPNVYINYADLKINGITINVNNATNVLSTTYHSTVYKDYLIDISDLLVNECVDIQHSHLINIGYTDTFVSLSGINDYMRLSVLYVNNVVSNLLLPQDGNSSPGPTIKSWTANYRIRFKKSSIETYALRLSLLRELSNLNDLMVVGDVMLVGSNKVSFAIVNSCQLSVARPDGSKLLIDLPSREYTISGHMLNLLVSNFYGFTQCGLWCKQWIAQSHLNSDALLTTKLNNAVSNFLVYDYDPEKDLRNVWHSKIDVIIALIIGPRYVEAFVGPLDTWTRIRFDILCNTLLSVVLSN